MRTVISRWRANPRASKRFATFTQTDEKKHHGGRHQDPQSILGTSQHPVAKKPQVEDVVPIRCRKLAAEFGADGCKVLLGVV